MMFGDFEDRVRDKLDLAARPSPENKVMGLGRAVSELVRPGMHLHIAQAYLRPSAAIYEICRRFWGTDPGFTISSLGFIANMVLFVHGGLARKLITTFCGDHYPFPSPNRVYQEAWRDGRVEIENWSVLTLPQRLLAGAMGVEWMTTHSIREAPWPRRTGAISGRAADPDGNRVGMVRALRPDLVVLHAWAADPAGNVMLLPPYAENALSAFAAKEGALVTVEKVVDTDFLEEIFTLCKNTRMPGAGSLPCAHGRAPLRGFQSGVEGTGRLRRGRGVPAGAAGSLPERGDHA